MQPILYFFGKRDFSRRYDMQCAIITSNTTAGLETAVNAWLTEHMNRGEEVSIEYVTMSEGTIGSATIKVLIFYKSNFTRSTI